MTVELNAMQHLLGFNEILVTNLAACCKIRRRRQILFYLMGLLCPELCVWVKTLQTLPTPTSRFELNKAHWALLASGLRSKHERLM